jgi:quinohemoprotein ethanol dehydrogenase
MNSSAFRILLGATLLSVGSAAALAAPGRASVDGARLAAADREPGQWMAVGRTFSEQRFSPLTQVNDRNVQDLGLAWTFKYELDRVVEATPVVVDGVM